MFLFSLLWSADDTLCVLGRVFNIALHALGEDRIFLNLDGQRATTDANAGEILATSC